MDGITKDSSNSDVLKAGYAWREYAISRSMDYFRTSKGTVSIPVGKVKLHDIGWIIDCPLESDVLRALNA